MRSPPMRTSPLSGGIRPSMIRRRVDFPHPLGPTKQVNACSGSVRFTSLRTLSIPSFPWRGNDLLTPVITTSGKDSLSVSTALDLRLHDLLW